jgi:hypothetical protein
MSILEDPENENGQDISPSKKTSTQHKQAELDTLEEHVTLEEHDTLEEILQPQIGNPILKDEFMPNDETASYDKTE